MNSPISPLARIGAGFTALLALLSLWPPVVSWWPLTRLFWPLVLLVGALLLLWPEKLPPRLQRIGTHRHFGVAFAALVWANFWVYGGILWVLAAVPLALTFWRGADWNWNPRLMSRARQWFAVAAFAALICLRLNWTSAQVGTGSYFSGGMNYGLNTYNPTTGYYDWGWQYNALQNINPGLMLTYYFTGTQLTGGLWASLVSLLVLVAAARRDFSMGRRELLWGMGTLALWWAYNLLRGNIESIAAWLFAGALGAMLAGIRMSDVRNRMSDNSAETRI